MNALTQATNNVSSMSTNLKNHGECLRTLCKARPNTRVRLLKELVKSRKFLRCICECSLNLIKARVPISRAQKRTLSKHKKVLRLLANKKASIVKKRMVVSQSGGFLQP